VVSWLGSSTPDGRIGTLLIVVMAAQFLTPMLGAQPSSVHPPPSGLDRYVPLSSAEQSRGKVVLLGRRLFFDPVLSRDSSLACASCHRPKHGFANDRVVGIGVDGRRGRRNVPPLINRGWGGSFSWDGKAETLEEQVLLPIGDPAELGLPLMTAVERLRTDRVYRDDFLSAFGREPDTETLALTLAAYVRSIRAGDSPFDRLVEGDESALTEIERRGLKLFRGRARCDRCHLGPLFTDDSFHDTGVAWRNGTPSDSGRAVLTGRPEHLGAFKTPTLRELPRTAPYMHDGSLATLEEVVEFYDGGGHPNPVLDPLIRPLGLNGNEKSALVSFLRALSGRVVEGVRHRASASP
jgi:cytochrome c peroxidase